MSQLGLACRDFLVGYLITLVAMIAVAWVMHLIGFPIGGATASVPAVLGALIAGGRYGLRTGQRPEPAFSWRFAFLATAICAVLSLLALGLVSLVLGAEGRQEIMGVARHADIAAVAMAALLVIYALAIRFVFPFSASNAIKNRDRRNTAR